MTVIANHAKRVARLGLAAAAEVERDMLSGMKRMWLLELEGRCNCTAGPSPGPSLTPTLAEKGSIHWRQCPMFGNQTLYTKHSGLILN